MANPKYADLPGIAYDQPDVYETSDLPEADQDEALTEEESESIERLHISANEAFSKFKGKSLNNSKTDFSDRLSKVLNRGYDARSGDWELAGECEKETVLQKYQRLQCECKELAEEVTKLQDGSKSDTDNFTESTNLTNQVKVIEKELCDLHLEEILGSELIDNLRDPQGAQLKKLISHLEKFKQSSSGSSAKKQMKAKETEVSEKGIVKYQLNYRPDQARLNETTRITQLEQRISHLENLLGSTEKHKNLLALEGHRKSLLETAQILNAKVTLLDQGHLDHIEGRLTAVNQKMDTIAEKAAGINVDENKIIELYDLVKKLEPLAQNLPQTLDRMLALESLHQQAEYFSKSLTQLEDLQSQLTNGFQGNETLLKEVQGSFLQNVEMINKNMKSLDERISKLDLKKS